MDINNYSYTNNFDADAAIKEYHNDDMYAEIYKNRAYDHIYYEVYACSYDGQLEIAETCDSLAIAERLFNFIVDNYATTPPNDLLPIYLEQLKTA